MRIILSDRTTLRLLRVAKAVVLRAPNRSEILSSAAIDATATAQINGLDGNDYLISGNNNDYVQGWNGNDWVLAQAGGDVIFGLTGNDYVMAGDGDDNNAGDGMNLWKEAA